MVTNFTYISEKNHYTNTTSENKNEIKLLPCTPIFYCFSKTQNTQKCIEIILPLLDKIYTEFPQ